MTRIIRIHLLHIALWAVGVLIIAKLADYYQPYALVNIVGSLIYSFGCYNLFPWIPVRYETHK